MDNKKYDSLLFKSKASPILQNLLITFLGDNVFFGVSFNFMQVMTYDMGTSPGHRRGGLIFCILRGLSSPHHRHISFEFTSLCLRDDSNSMNHCKHISRYLYHSIRKEGIIRKA